MNTIDEYMKIPYRMEIIEDTAEGGYVASYPDLKGYINPRYRCHDLAFRHDFSLCSMI